MQAWWRRLAIAALLCGLLTGCSIKQVAAPTSPPLSATFTTPAPPKPTPQPTITKVAPDWEAVAEGLEFRTIRLRANSITGEFAVIRLDPAQYRIRVAYDRLHPGSVKEWAAAVKPVALINGGYFDENKKATALVIFDGVPQGTSYEGFGGMVVVNPKGQFELRSLRQQPYDPDEPLQQAMQSAPMLIQPGGTLSDLQADNDRARRTVIARDHAGRILLMVNDFPAFTLPELAQALKDSPLDLDAALNLDGGRSSGMYLNSARKQMLVEAFEQLPLMLVVDKQ